VDVPVHVLDRVIDNRVLKVAFETIVGLEFIGEDCATGLYVLPHPFLKFMLAPTIYNLQANVSAPLNHTHYSDLVIAASPGNNTSAARLVHIARLPADKVSSISIWPANLFEDLSCIASRMR
jgi:hypothetical protein